jgi:hypothetical protein
MLAASAPIVTIALAPTIAANSFAVFRLFESIVTLHFMAVARFGPCGAANRESAGKTQ